MKLYNILLILINTAMAALLVTAAVGDIRRQTISGGILITLLAVSIASVFISKELNVVDSLWALGAVFLLLSFVYFISKKSIEWGDVLLCSSIAPYLGFQRAYTMLFISMLFCGLFSLILLLINKTNRNLKIPFAPFVVIGTIAAIIL